MVLVAGATGLLIGEVCRKLVERGEKGRALIRATSSGERVEALRATGAELCVGDLKDPKSLMAACRGADAVISTASSTLSRQAGTRLNRLTEPGS